MQQQDGQLGDIEAEDVGPTIAQEDQAGGKVPDEEAEHRADAGNRQPYELDIPDLERDIRSLPGFTPAEKYGTISPWENELGKIDDVRYVTSTIFEPWVDAGGAKGTMLSTSGTNADVYPVLYLGKDAYGIIALKGAYAVTPMVVNPKPSDSDPLAQRGHAGFKTMQTAVILNDLWVLRAEVSATA